MPRKQAQNRVAILAYPEVALFELACAVELFALDRPEFKEWYTTDVVTFHDLPSTTTASLTLSGIRRVEDLSQYSHVVIPSWNTGAPLAIPDKLKSSLLEFNQLGGRLISFCSGAFLLAACGILDGLSATTHWRYAQKFQELFPRVTYVGDKLYTQQGNIACSAGSAAGIDLGLEIIRQDFGMACALSVAKRMVMTPHRKGGQEQFVESPTPNSNNRLSQSLDWALERISTDFTVEDWAQQVSMSRRSFDRHFRRLYGSSPKQWIIRQRIQRAQSLLESSNINIDLVATNCGFENSLSLRQHFKRQLGVTPRQYRDNFAAFVD